MVLGAAAGRRMTRKQLPKAIVRPLDSLRVARGAVARRERPCPRGHRLCRHDAVEPEPALGVSSAPIANDTVPAGSPAAPRNATARRRCGWRAKSSSVTGTMQRWAGSLPLPIVIVAGVTAINLRMVKQLSDLYGVPFQRDRTRAIIVGLIGGAVPTGLGRDDQLQHSSSSSRERARRPGGFRGYRRRVDPRHRLGLRRAFRERRDVARHRRSLSG